MTTVERDTRNRHLAAMARSGDGAAREALIVENRPLALQLAVRTAKASKRSLDDVISDAVVGLIRAADLYDPDNARGASFATYATYWIRQTMQRHGREDRLIRVAHYAYDRNARAGAKADAAKVWSSAFISIRVSPGEPGAAEPAGREADPAEAVADAEAQQVTEARHREQVERLLAVLTDRRREIVRRRFGIGQEGEQTEAEIAAEFGVSKQAIGGAHRLAMAELRAVVRRAIRVGRESA